MDDVPLPLDDMERIVIHAKDVEKSRRKLTRDFVDKLQDAMERKQVADEDIKILVGSAKTKGFSKYDIAAMKRSASLRMKDKVEDERRKLAAQERVSTAIGLDLFDFAAARA